MRLVRDALAEVGCSAFANNARTINLGEVDMRRQRNQHARAAAEFWE